MQVLWHAGRQFLKKLKAEPACDPASPLPAVRSAAPGAGLDRASARPCARRRRSQEPEGGSADGRTDTRSMLYAGDEMSFSPKEEGISDTLQRARTLTARRGETSPSQTLRDQSQGEPGRPDAQRQNVPRRLLATA